MSRVSDEYHGTLGMLSPPRASHALARVAVVVALLARQTEVLEGAEVGTRSDVRRRVRLNCVHAEVDDRFHARFIARCGIYVGCEGRLLSGWSGQHLGDRRVQLLEGRGRRRGWRF